MKALLAALHKAQQQFDPLKKNSTNGRGMYADLSAVFDVIQKPLWANGLTVVQLPHAHADERGQLWVEVVTTLYHAESGESLSDTLPMPVAKADPQGIGSAITYGRRYALISMFGLAPEDDDGNEASQPAPERKAQRPQRNGQPAQRPQAETPARPVATAQPTGTPFATHDAAVQYAVDSGAYAALTEAQAAYKQFARSAGWSGKGDGKIDTPRLFELWQQEVERQVTRNVEEVAF